MPVNNYERMIQLAEDVFAAREDPDQLHVNPVVMSRLMEIHPSTIMEYNEGNGPVAWVLVIPTTTELMHRFLRNEISESELFAQTPVRAKYEALYLCSALVLGEYRRKGITRSLITKAITNISQDHPLKSLFVWPFTDEGEKTAEMIASQVSLPLYKRENLKPDPSSK